MKINYTYQSQLSGKLVTQFHTTINTSLTAIINDKKKTFKIQSDSYCEISMSIKHNTNNNISLLFGSKNFIDNNQIVIINNWLQPNNLLSSTKNALISSISDPVIQFKSITLVRDRSFHKLSKDELAARLTLTEHKLSEFNRTYGGPLKFANPFFRILHRVLSIFRPRIGNLVQYKSKELSSILIKAEKKPSYCPK
ncbi:hypothetical protein OAR47_03325, partial [Gammaproteobacteria bacterium]|nr:hypothetical protein [Gammaproteobacteria bacterium]